MKTQNKIYIIVSIFVLAAIFIAGFFTYPTFQEIKNGADEVLSGRGKLVFIDAENRALDHFKENDKDYEPNFQKINALFVDSQDPIDFIKFLETMASDAKLTSDINLASSPSKNKAGAAPAAVFQVDVKGDFIGVVTFLKKLENGPYLVTVDKLTIQKSDQVAVQDTKDAKNNKPPKISQPVEASFLIEAATK